MDWKDNHVKIFNGLLAVQDTIIKMLHHLNNLEYEFAQAEKRAFLSECKFVPPERPQQPKENPNQLVFDVIKTGV